MPKDTQLTFTISARDLRDALADVNDERRQSGYPKLTIQHTRAALKDPERLKDLAALYLEETIEFIA